MMTSLKTDTSHPADAGDHGGIPDIGAVLTRGAVAGLAGGLLFALANMWHAESQGKPIVAPFAAISTIFRGSDMPVMMSPPDIIAGLVTHLGLSLLFGMVFAVVVWLLRLSSKPPLLLAVGLAYGLLLYVVNFQVVARLAFPWFVNPNGPNQIFELWIHPVAYGLVLVPFFLGFRISTRR